MEHDMLDKTKNIYREKSDLSEIGDISVALPMWQKISQMTWLRKTLILIVMILGWEFYARHLNDALLFPTFTATAKTWFSLLLDGTLADKTWTSLKVLGMGYGLGILLATVLAVAATLTKLGQDILETLTAMFSPLPAIALLPLALIWFGMGNGSLVFVIVHSVLWPVALSMLSGFKAVAPTLRKVGRNYGLTGFGYARHILFPAALNSILTGFKIGWSYSWRTLVAAELIFGAASGNGGLGFFISESKNNLLIPEVFAGLLSVIIIGLLVEAVVFRIIENKTVKKWGMQS
jgi:NitT/TauT family transport system permease protein